MQPHYKPPDAYITILFTISCSSTSSPSYLLYRLKVCLRVHIAHLECNLLYSWTLVFRLWIAVHNVLLCYLQLSFTYLLLVVWFTMIQVLEVFFLFHTKAAVGCLFCIYLNKMKSDVTWLFFQLCFFFFFCNFLHYKWTGRAHPSPALCVICTVFLLEKRKPCMCIKCIPLLTMGACSALWLFPQTSTPYSSSATPNKRPTLTTLSWPRSMPSPLYLIPLSFSSDLAMLFPEHLHMICSTF